MVGAVGTSLVMSARVDGVSAATGSGASAVVSSSAARLDGFRPVRFSARDGLADTGTVPLSVAIPAAAAERLWDRVVARTGCRTRLSDGRPALAVFFFTAVRRGAAVVRLVFFVR
eukprot:jgi/Mesvir1/1811/Mv24245-RA.1